MANQNSDDRLLAVLAHLSSFLFPVVLPLILWIVEKDKKGKEWAAGQAKQALVYQLAVMVVTTILGGIAVVFVLGTFGLGALLVLPIAAVYFLVVGVALPVYAAVKSYNGDDYKYPVVGGLWQ
jgi:uncharacterized Tic20 family protein